MLHKPVTWHCHITQQEKNSQKNLKSRNSPISSDAYSDHSDARRTSGTGAPPFCENNQIFRKRDLEKKGRGNRKELLAKCSWDTGEPDSGLCSELEQDVDKSAWGGMHFKVLHFIRRQSRNIWVMRNCTPSSASAPTASFSRVHSSR